MGVRWRTFLRIKNKRMKVMTFSTRFPSYHPKKNSPTLFVEKIWKGLNISADYSVWTNKPRQMKDGNWQLPHMWRDMMNDTTFLPKYHTIRAGNRWKVGDVFSPRFWGSDVNPKSGRTGPYQSK